MATQSTNPALGSRYSLARNNPPSTSGAAAFSTTPAFPTHPKSNAQRIEAERLEKERRAREEQARMEAAGQSSLAELSEEQREEIGEAVSTSLLQREMESGFRQQC